MNLVGWVYMDIRLQSQLGSSVPRERPSSVHRKNIWNVFFLAQCFNNPKCSLRPWVTSLESYLPAWKAQELKESAEAAGVEMVRKYIDSDGRTRVSTSQFSVFSICHFQPMAH